jgi:hypothetical protein
MKKIICLFLFAVSTIVIANAAGFPARNQKSTKPSATLQKMWVEYGQTLHEEYGMILHFNFTAYDLEGTDMLLCVYFQYNDASAAFLKDKNGRYNSTTGQVSVSKSFRPSYPSSIFTDFQIFMPYTELDLSAGEYNLTMNVQVVYPQGGTVAWLKLYDFDYTAYDEPRAINSKPTNKASIHPIATSGPRAVFDTLWIEHNVTQDGVKGMLMHFKFTTYAMKDMDADVAVYFSYNDGSNKPLKDKNQKFFSSDGVVAVYRDIKPAYDVTNYDDLQVFMPMDEFDLEPGKYKLILDAKLIYPKGGLINYFTYYGFDYSK